jgi:hypothetical protein
MGDFGSFDGPLEDRGTTPTDRVREHLRVLAGAAAVGWVVAGALGGIVGRLAMRLLVLTSDDRLAGAITDDDATVNKFTFGGSAGLFLFLALGGIVLSWLYVGARTSMPDAPLARAGIWGVLVWSVTGAGVFDPNGFDFTQLSPRWLGVLLFSAIFLGIGAGIALGVERAIDRWPRRRLALLPIVLVGPMFPVYLGGIVAAWGAEFSERNRALRRLGAVVMAGIFVALGIPTIADVIRILA